MLRYERRGRIVMRRRRILARQTVVGADERDGAGNDGAKKRQEDDRFVHFTACPRAYLVTVILRWPQNGPRRMNRPTEIGLSDFGINEGGDVVWSFKSLSPSSNS